MTGASSIFLTRFKRCLLVFLSFVLALALCPALAYADDGSSGEEILFTEAMAVRMSQEFADSMEPDAGLSASDPVKLYDESGQAIGYIVEYYAQDGGDSGYVVFDNSHPSLIAEYSFDDGSVSPYTAAVRRTPSDDGVMPLSCEGMKAVKTSAFCYAALDEQTGEAFDMYGQDVTEELADAPSALSTPATGSWDDIFICYVGDARYSVVSMKTIPEFIAIDESWVERETGRYACAVSAMMISSVYYLQNSFNWGNLGGEYLDLWSRSGTYVDYVRDDGITNGLTPVVNIGKTLKSYCSDNGRSITYTENSNPSYDQFASVINRGDVAIFSCGIYRSDLDAKVGHSMVVEGYAKLKLSSGASDYLYSLLVCDGWYSTARHLNFYYTAYTSTYGTFFKG